MDLLPNQTTTKDHEKLFDEICSKLQELSLRSEVAAPQRSQDRLDKMQSHFRKSHEELKQAQLDIQDKIKSLESLSFTNSEIHDSAQKIIDQLTAERANNSKLSTDLAKSLELTLKLQFEIEEIRAKSNQILNEEKKHNSFLQEKNRGLSHELNLSQALCNEMRLELNKAKDRFQADAQAWQKEKTDLQTTLQEHILTVDERDVDIRKIQAALQAKNDEIAEIEKNLIEFQEFSEQQQNLVVSLTTVAEKKMVELKLALDKKSAECKDYYSHLQQTLTQTNLLKQENLALKEYIGKISSLHQQGRPNEEAAPMK